MSGAPVVLSSFQGGLNNVDSISAIDNGELHQIVNFDLSSTGTLFGRPPITKQSVTPGFDDQIVTNLLTNPGLTNDATNWGMTGTVTSLTSARVNIPGTSRTGGPMWRVTTTAVVDPSVYSTRYTALNSIQQGQTYSFGVWQRLNADVARNNFLRVAWLNAQNQVINLSAGDITMVTSWTRLTAVGLTAPTGAVSVYIDVVTIAGQATYPSGTIADYEDAMMVVGSDLPDYFDGATADVDPYDYAWVGPAGASTSTRTSSGAGAPQAMDLLGYFTDDASITWVVVATKSKTWLYSPLTNTWKNCAPFAAADCVQYQSRLYLVCETLQGGYYARPTLGADYAYNSLATSGTNSKPMPKGSQIVVYQDRLWIAGPRKSDNSSTLFFSNITSTSAATNINEFVGDFIAVQPGDGQAIVKLEVGQNDLFIFRSSSTWRFIYDGVPSSGRLTPISPFVGADSKYSVALRENYVITLSGGTLYEMVSYVFYPLNSPKSIRFIGAADTNPRRIDYAVSLLGNRAMVWSKGAMYVFDTNLRTWTMWDSPTTRGAYFLRYPNGNDVFGADTAFGISASDAGSYYNLYRVLDATTSDATEEMTCVVQTKAYDYDQPGDYKRMWWWGTNIATGREVRGSAIPLNLNEDQVTWDEMDLHTWDELDLGTWDYPLIPSPSIDTTRDFAAAAPAQVFVKMMQGMRFRQCSFRIILSTDGSTGTGPVRVDSLTTWVEVKKKVTRGVS